MMKTVKKSFAIINMLAEEPDTFHASGKIADTLKLKRPTCSLLLKSLTELGVLQQQSPRGGYKLGYILYYLTRNGPFRKDISIPAHPLLEEFAEKTGETIILSLFYNNKRIILDCIEGSNSIQIRKDVLFLEDFYQTASGRLLISFLPARERSFFLDRYGLPSTHVWKEASTYDGFERTVKSIYEKKMELNRIKDTSYFQIAVPVIDENDKCIAALSVPVPDFRFKGERRKTIIKLLQETAGKISRNIIKSRRF